MSTDPRKRADARSGVTLIELVVALVLVGVLVLSVILSVLPATEGMLLTRRNVEAAQKAQFAVTRLLREFTAITNVVSGSSQVFVYDMVDDGGATFRRTAAWSAGGPLTLNGVPLSDDVELFALRYYATPGGGAQVAWTPSLPLVEFVLQPASAGGMVYTNRVFLRDF